MDFKLDLAKKYLIAVSGGPDSMALLDMCFKQTSKLVVAHINYKKRKSSDRDEQIVSAYCQQHRIPLFVSVVKEHSTGNFQNWAREYRYRFFNKIYHEQGCNCLLIAHQEDDYIETYLLKQQRDSYSENLAIQQSNHIFDMDIYRPLLKISKKNLEQYCLDNQLDYGIDESNLSDIYARNVMRKQVSKLTSEEREKLLCQIAREQALQNQENQRVQESYLNCLKGQVLSIKSLLSLAQDLQSKVLYKFIEKHSSIRSALISKGRLEDILTKLHTNKPGVSIILSSGEVIVRNYDDLVIAPPALKKDFSYTLGSFEEMETPEFKIQKSGPKMNGIYVEESDFPLTIRSYQNTDIIEINEGHKKVNRFFIDAKISLAQRKSTPLVVNNKNRIILISGFYQDIRRKRLQSNLFVLKC